MTSLLFIIAALCMVVGYLFKVKRWKLFISVYEEPSESNLLNAMTLGHVLNMILPIRLGYIVRVIWSGRKLKNGYAFALATVIADLYVDVITVGAICVGFSVVGQGGAGVLEMARLYMLAFICIFPLTVIAVTFRKGIKIIIRAVASIFNEKIELGLLYITYLCIASIKDIVKNINRVKFVIYTALMWCGYVLSYIIFAQAIQRYGYYYVTLDIFTQLFSGSNVYKVDDSVFAFWMAYLLLPLGVCWIIAMIIGRNKQGVEKKYRLTLPHMNQSDRLAFLKTYYEEDNRENIQSYLEINKDVTVIEDNSAGSNASTVLVMKPNGSLFFRKYAFNEDGEKLQEQIQWIESHQADIPLPIVVGQCHTDNFTTYDMHSYSGVTGLFRYIHTMPVENSWRILEHALDDIRANLHEKNTRKADSTTIKAYISSKVEKNLKIIKEQTRHIRALEEYDTIYVNGRTLPTLKFYSDMLEQGHLESIFINDVYSHIHGDLTIENIVCVSDQHEINKEEYYEKVVPVDYYFIDPNTGNVHDSPFLDYGKLLQSLHGNYEFLMMVSSVKINKDQVNFMMTKSEVYGKVYNKYKEYLNKNFSKDQVLSIYYHEIIHWLRLMPYKIRKNEELAVVFYTGLLTVLNDVWEMENVE